MALLYTKISGFKFNEIYKGKKFYKFLNNNLIHHKFQYGLGLNVDVLSFNPNGKCLPGGLYFCEQDKCYKYWNHFDCRVATIEIPDDANVYIEEDKFKADQLTIKEIKHFDEMDEDIWINILQKYGNGLRYINNQTDKLCRYAIEQNYCALEFVKDQNDDICTFAIKQNPDALRFIKIH